MTDTLVICTVKNQQNAKHGVYIKTIKRVANGMLTDRKSRKVGEVGMSEQMIINVLILINILILVFRVRRLEKRIKQLEGR